MLCAGCCTVVTAVAVERGSIQRDRVSVTRSISAISAFLRITATNVVRFSLTNLLHRVVGPTKFGPFPVAIFVAMVDGVLQSLRLDCRDHDRNQFVIARPVHLRQ